MPNCNKCKISTNIKAAGQYWCTDCMFKQKAEAAIANNKRVKIVYLNNK